jgi:hypothetical protein
MSEHEARFLKALRAKFQDMPFSPMEALNDFQLSELPDSIRLYLTVHGPGIGTTKAMARWLAGAGATRLSTRTRGGYLWVLP